LDIRFLPRVSLSSARETAKISPLLPPFTIFRLFTDSTPTPITVGSIFILFLIQIYKVSLHVMGFSQLNICRYACKWWTTNLHQNATLTTTHDLSFMISPWARPAWELEKDSRAYGTLITAAKTLAQRYSPKTQCLRSWDTCVTNRYSFVDPSEDFLVIIVSVSRPLINRPQFISCFISLHNTDGK